MNIKLDKLARNYPAMQNTHMGPRLPYGTLPKNRGPNPFWYMQKRGDPIMAKALMTAFQQPAKIIQRRVNHQRRPFDAYRGY